MMLKNKDLALKNIDKVVAKHNKGGTTSIQSTPGAQTSEYDYLLNLSESQLMDKIVRMDDDEYDKFLSNAPKALRDKYPDLDWKGKAA
jgi:hypothetical protein